MSKCCKYAKWFPHNWLCLRGLSYVFIALFYVALVYWICSVILVLKNFGMTALVPVVQFTCYVFLAAAISLSIAKALAALHAIKHAVAPCCCESKKEETK